VSPLSIVGILFLISAFFYLRLMTSEFNRFVNSDTILLNQTGTIWESDDPEIQIGVYDSSDPEYANGVINGTITTKNRTFNTRWFTEQGAIYVNDSDKYGKGYSKSEERIFSGDCDFSKTRMEIEVGYSNIEEIKVGDIIVLERKDE